MDYSNTIFENHQANGVVLVLVLLFTVGVDDDNLFAIFLIILRTLKLTRCNSASASSNSLWMVWISSSTPFSDLSSSIIIIMWLKLCIRLEIDAGLKGLVVKSRKIRVLNIINPPDELMMNSGYLIILTCRILTFF